MTSPDPEPNRTTGLEPGGGVPPGETPPAEGGTSGVARPDPPAVRRKGWGALPLVLIILLAAVIAIGLIGMAVSLIVQ
ncbi:DUF6480 family protein [Streptomyces neyagawaensis]|uniref:DUF6480 family protein n=1 Tax=Streptomyces neyagawaensis TaxID=42238 RepID=UPI00201CF652|nr:DUF6480 family protein [Streptomyces neyagawaensis]MCL6734560.1 DUF6480 family protein [Streptomyces neyagawaensis]MDE1685674.1 DUF6480 family protein [Streptomyces neyagawaensis]